MHNHRQLFAPAKLALAILGTASQFSLTPAAAEGEFSPLGDLPGGGEYSAVFAVSGNGKVAVGYSVSGNGLEAFRWTAGGGMTGLGDLPGGEFLSGARAVNGDGTVVAGYGSNASGNEAFRWTQAGGMVGLGDLPGGDFNSAAFGISADGSVVVGLANSAAGQEAFRWTQADGMEGLGDLPGNSFSSCAYGVSGDGKVVVGASDGPNGTEAFRWTQAGGMEGLGHLPGGIFGSVAASANANGRVVVGYANGPDGLEAFRWTRRAGMVGLGDLPGGSFLSMGLAVNADGTVVVGRSDASYGIAAFRWTQAGGMQSVKGWLAEHGVALAPGYRLDCATDVSDDGNVVVGTTGMESWLARVSELGSGVLELDQNLIRSLAGTACALDGVMGYGNLVLNGSHHRPLMDSAMPEGKLFSWASGDWGDYRGDFSVGLGEAGMGGFLIPGRLAGGVGVGGGIIEQGTVFSGETDLEGAHLLGEVDYRPAGRGPDLLFSLTGFYGDWGAEIRRGYRNAGLVDGSRGETDVAESAVRVRVDWLDAWTWGRVCFSPRVQASVLHAEMDGYTEKGGGFPASFAARDQTAREMRYGLRARTGIGAETVVHADVEGIHRFDDAGAVTSGEVLGLFPFEIQGDRTAKDWVRFGLEMDRALSAHWGLSISGHVASAGEDPEVSGGVSLKAGW